MTPTPDPLTAEEEAEYVTTVLPLTDGEKLRALALWFDTWDNDRVTAARILRGTGNSHEVQDDLRRIAAALAAQPAPPLDVERLAVALRAISTWRNDDTFLDVWSGEAAEIAREYAALSEPKP
jgi:hypothetical protein